MLSYLSLYETEAYFITKIYTQESCFDKNFNLKIRKPLYYIKISMLFADVLMFKH